MFICKFLRDFKAVLMILVVMLSPFARTYVVSVPKSSVRTANWRSALMAQARGSSLKNIKEKSNAVFFSILRFLGVNISRFRISNWRGQDISIDMFILGTSEKGSAGGQPQLLPYDRRGKRGRVPFSRKSP